MSSLNKILFLLKKNYKKINVPISLYWGYPDIEFSGKLKKINIYDLFINYFIDFLLKPQDYKINNNFNQSVIYSAFIRTTTAFDFDNDRKLSLKDKFGLRETGTTLRMFLLLPLLKRIGVNVLYLLPITMSSRNYKKGEAPTPYSIKNFFKIDPDLYDPMLGKYTEEKNELLFKGLVEACHKLGIKVLLDFIPRTGARDNELILEHPEWFYWINKEHEKDIKPPQIKGITFTPFHRKYIKKIYNSYNVKEFLKKFTFSPDRIDRNKWDKLVKKIKKDKIDNFLKNIEDEFNITTVSGFSDVINDTQPLWTEVTFLRMFNDFPEISKKFVKKDQPPYILYDIIKSSKAPGRKINKPLWELLSSILPFWQKRYKIDGVRIDMAHALPCKLEEKIIKSIKKLDKNFILIAEEMDCSNSEKAKKTGYSSIAGSLFLTEPRWRKKEIIRFMQKELPGLKLPILASSETHDTPRTLSRDGKIRFYYFSAVLNYFLPNSVPFINTGFELKEIQPMNKGLDSQFSNIYCLPRRDLNYGKMALFDYTCFHWDKDNRKIIRLMEFCSNLIVKNKAFKKFNNFKIMNIDHLYVTGYTISCKKSLYLFIINTHMNKNFKISFRLKQIFKKFDIIFSSYMYLKRDIFTHADIIKRIKMNKRICNIKVKRSEIVIIKLKKGRCNTIATL